MLAQVQGASVLGRVATGPRAGQRVLRLGNDPTAPVVITGGPHQAHLEGLDLHAATAVRADERERLERDEECKWKTGNWKPGTGNDQCLGGDR